MLLTPKENKLWDNADGASIAITQPDKQQRDYAVPRIMRYPAVVALGSTWRAAEPSCP